MNGTRRVVVLQSNYLPWKGYFDLLRHADTFVFHDDVQFTKQDWRNRNRIKTPAGPRWLTIPCGTREDRRVCDVRIDGSNWPRQHWRRIESSYSRAAHWSYCEAVVAPLLLERRWTFLSDLNQAIIEHLARDVFAARTEFDDSRRHHLTGHKTERLIQLLTSLGATHYLSGPSGRNYLQEEAFERSGIDLEYFDYDGYPEYAQLHGAFVHPVSVVDLLAHTGPAALQYLQRQPAPTSAWARLRVPESDVAAAVRSRPLAPGGGEPGVQRPGSADR